MNKYNFEKINPTAEDWKRIEGAEESTCFHAEKWYAYLRRIGVRPFIAAVYAAPEEGVKCKV